MTATSIRGIEAFAGMPAGELTRHSGSMLLVDRLQEIGPSHAVCSWSPPESLPDLQDDHGIPSYLAIECMAQAVAVLAGARARLDGLPPPIGLLLGTRSFQAAVSYLESGANYRISCREIIRDAQGLASFDCSMETGNRTVASCRLTVFELESGKRFGD